MSIASSYAAMSNADTARRQENRQRRQQEYTERAGGFTRDSTGNLVPTDLKASQEAVQKSQFDIMQEQFNAQQQTLQAIQSKFNADGITDIMSNIVDGNWKDAYNTWNTTPGLKKAIQSAPGLNTREIAPVNFNDPNDIKQLKAIGVPLEKLNDPEVQSALQSTLMRVQGHDGTWRVVPVDSVINQTNTHNMFNAEQSKRYQERLQKINGVIKGLSPAQVEAQEAKAQTELGTSQITQGFIQDLQSQIESGTLSPEEAFKQLTMATNPKSQGKTTYAPSEMEKTSNYLRSQFGDEVAEAYVNKKIAGSVPAAIQKDEYETSQIQNIQAEAGARDLAEVDYKKLSGENLVNFNKEVSEEIKRIDKDDVQAFTSIALAADKLNSKSLAKTTGVIDASVSGAMERIGMDIQDDILVQSSNYNLILNSLTRASFGSQVTGYELTRIKAQLGTEFRADKTVRVKMAETLENTAGKFEIYRSVAPAFYAKEMRQRVNNMRDVAGYLRQETPGSSNIMTPSNTKIYNGVTYIKNDKSGMWEPQK